jgi:hypothetical protein
MAQNREAPAYQEYAAATMARTHYRVMTLAERGLLYSMRLECWVNRSVPADPHMLARVLGYDAGEVVNALPGVMPFFTSDGREITCPELEDYRAHLAAIREKQSSGGKQGAAKTNSKRLPAEHPTQPGDPPGNPRVTCGSLVKSSPVKPNSIQVLTVAPIDDPWVNEYDMASNGR